MRPLIGLCLLLSAAPAWADSPLVRGGEWETRVGMNGAPPSQAMSRKVCHPSDERLTPERVRAMMVRFTTRCSRKDVSGSGNVINFDFACEVREAHVSVQGTLTVEDEDTIAATSHSHIEGGKVTIPDMTMNAVSHRLGPCQPGDMAEPPPR